MSRNWQTGRWSNWSYGVVNNWGIRNCVRFKHDEFGAAGLNQQSNRPGVLLLCPGETDGC